MLRKRQSERGAPEVERTLEHRTSTPTPQSAHPAGSPSLIEFNEPKGEMKTIFQHLDFSYRSLRLSVNRHNKAIQGSDHDHAHGRRETPQQKFKNELAAVQKYLKQVQVQLQDSTPLQDEHRKRVSSEV